MSVTINTVTLNGKVVSDLNLRKTNNKGVSVTNFRIQHNAPRLKHPVYIDVEVWGAEAETLVAQAKRGSFVVVYAELRRDVWNAEDGSPRSKLKLTASRVVVDEGYIREEGEKRAESANIAF